MDKNEFKKAYDKLKDQLRELEIQHRQQGDARVEYSINELEALVENGQMPKELLDWYKKWLIEQKHQANNWLMFLDSNPDLPEPDRMMHFYDLPRILSFEESLKHYEEAVKLGQIYNAIWTSRHPDLLAQSEVHNLPTKFFNSIREDEFGISRLMADRLNNIHKMLEQFTSPQLINDGLYLIQAECKDSKENNIRLEYRFRASNLKDASFQAQEYIQRLTGRQKKVYEACWALANKRQSRIFTCDLTELMLIAYPGRKNKNSFSIAQKLDFFQDLLDLSQTQLTLQKANPAKAPKKKDCLDTFLLPFLTIHKTSGYNMVDSKKSNRYPNSISCSVLHNPLYERETMYNVGAGIKHKTLELRTEDNGLAEWIQIRKSQWVGEYITFKDRNDLLKLAGLDGIMHTGMANKRLLEKFGRLKDKGIIISYPNHVTFPFLVKIR